MLYRGNRAVHRDKINRICLCIADLLIRGGDGNIVGISFFCITWQAEDQPQKIAVLAIRIRIGGNKAEHAVFPRGNDLKCACSVEKISGQISVVNKARVILDTERKSRDPRIFEDLDIDNDRIMTAGIPVNNTVGVADYDSGDGKILLLDALRK